jgi:hypothetical protein
MSKENYDPFKTKSGKWGICDKKNQKCVRKLFKTEQEARNHIENKGY